VNRIAILIAFLWALGQPGDRAREAFEQAACEQRMNAFAESYNAVVREYNARRTWNAGAAKKASRAWEALKDSGCWVMAP